MSALRILELRSVVGSGGGPEKTILHGTARTDPKRYSITVCYLRDARDSKFDLADRARTAGVDYVEITERHSMDWSVWPALRELCLSRQIQIVHAHEYKTDLLAWLLARRTGTIPLATAHGWTGNSWRERQIYYPADKRLLATFPRVIAVSGEIKDELIRAGVQPPRIRVVLNGIDSQLFRRRPGVSAEVRRELGLPEAAFVIGSVGRLERQKRFDLLIDAFAGLHQRFPDLHLAIAGDGSLAGALQAQIDNLGLAATCHLLGHQPDIQRLHHALDLFVQSSDYEGTSNAILEAMAMETPIVATEAGGTAEQIDNGIHGLIVPCGSSQAIATAIELQFERPELAANMRAAARKRVEGPLSFDTRMKQVEEVYAELAGTRSERFPRA